MSGIEAGIPLVWRPERINYVPIHPACPEDPTHRAYPVEYDAARNAVVASVRHVRKARGIDEFNERWRDLLVDVAALDAIAAAGSEASDG